MKKVRILQSLNQISLGSLKVLAEKVSVLVDQKLWAKILVGMILGLFLGYLVSSFGPFASQLVPHAADLEVLLNWLALPAKLFLSVIQMVIIPLIIASVITGLASTSDISQMKNLGFKFGIFVAITSALGATLGIILTSIFKPGQFLGLSLPASTASGAAVDIKLQGLTPEFILKIIPINPLESIVQGQMLDVVIIAIIGGIALLSIEAKQAQIVLDLLQVVQNICMTVITWAMKIAPYAIFGMMISVTATTGLNALQSLSFYLLTVFAGFLLFIAIYSLLVFGFKQLSPLSFLKKILNPILLAFSTSSSAATMPVTLKAAEEELQISSSTANFLIPLGTTINMAGTAIWQTTAVVFLSQVYQLDLGLGQLAFVVATSVGSAIGSPGVPGVGMGVLAVVLARIGIPIEGIGLILGVDRIVDMGSTVVNVVGDLTAATLFDKKNSPLPPEIHN